MSVNSGTLTSRPVHPASPVLLTKNGPLGAHIRAQAQEIQEALASYTFKV